MIIEIQVSKHTDRIHVPSNTPVPNEKWQFVDSHGHLHAYVDSKLPTLVAVYDDNEDFDCYVCMHCAAIVTPGTRMPMSHEQYVQGLTRIEATLEESSEDGRYSATQRWDLSEEEYRGLLELSEIASKEYQAVYLKDLRPGYGTVTKSS